MFGCLPACGHCAAAGECDGKRAPAAAAPAQRARGPHRATRPVELFQFPYGVVRMVPCGHTTDRAVQLLYVTFRPGKEIDSVFCERCGVWRKLESPKSVPVLPDDPEGLF
jgi:hypothetical protein